MSDKPLSVYEVAQLTGITVRTFFSGSEDTSKNFSSKD